jgi:hypothetical protein
MDWIPLILICGTTPRTKILGAGANCPVCRGCGTTHAVEQSQRYCFFWIPLCRVGSTSQYAQCERCGSRMPAAVALPPLAPVAPAPAAPRPRAPGVDAPSAKQM